MTREEILAGMSALVDAATASGEAMPAEDVARYEALEVDLQAVAKTEEVVARQAAYKTVKGAPAFIAAKTEVAGEDDAQRAFTHYLRTGKPNSDLVVRAQSEASGAAGGYLVPEGFRQIIVERMLAFGGIQGGSESISTSTGNPLPWITNDDTSNTGAIVAEGGALGAGADLVFGTKVLGAYKYASNGASSLPLKVSYELLQDSAFDVGSFVARKLGERIGRKVAVDLANGSGSGEPTGLLSTAGGLGSTSAITAASPTYAQLVSAVHSLDPAYRQSGCVWVFNDAFLQLVRKIVDGNSRPLFWDQSMNLSNGLTGLTLLGFPVIIDQACPAAAGAVKFGFFGNLRQAYVVRSVKDISMITLNELYATTGQVGYMAWARLDATVQDANAGKLLLGA